MTNERTIFSRSFWSASTGRRCYYHRTIHWWLLTASLSRALVNRGHWENSLLTAALVRPNSREFVTKGTGKSAGFCSLPGFDASMRTFVVLVVLACLAVARDFITNNKCTTIVGNRSTGVLLSIMIEIIWPNRGIAHAQDANNTETAASCMRYS
jgi:hypothetical protein